MFKEDKQSRRLRQADEEYLAALEAGAFRRGPIPVRPRLLLEIYQAVHSGDPEQELIGCKMARKLIMYGAGFQAIDAIIDSGILPKCVKLLKQSDHETQMEVAWLVTKIAVGNVDRENGVWWNNKHVVMLVELGVVNTLIKLVNSTHLGVVDRAVVALGNIAADGPYPQLLVIKTGVVSQLVSHAMLQTTPTALLRNIAWIFSIFCGWPCEPSLQKLKQILSALATLAHLLKTDDAQVVFYSCRTVSSLTNRRLKDILNTDGLVGQLVHLLNSTERKIVIASLDAVTQLLTGNNKQVDCVMGAGPLIQILGRLMESSDAGIAKGAGWIISKIAGTTREQVDRVINGGLLPVLSKVIQTGATERKREAVWTVLTMARTGTSDQLALIGQSSNGVIPAICSIFTINDSDTWTTELALQTLQKLLSSAGREVQKEEYCKAIQECGGLASLEQLLIEHSDWEDEIYEGAYDIVNYYFHEVPRKDYWTNWCDDGADVKPAKVQKLD